MATNLQSKLQKPENFKRERYLTLPYIS